MGTERIEGRLAALREVRALATDYDCSYCNHAVSVESIDVLIADAEKDLYSVTPLIAYPSREAPPPKDLADTCHHDIPVGIYCDVCNGRYIE